ncbi:hypothetical protein [Thiohalocapsa halophila]|nr:hypothetical protein [Thiohalocapsa halophila]
MHPYIAYLVLTNPANHHPRPDESCPNLRQALAELWQRWLPGGRGRR